MAYCIIHNVDGISWSGEKYGCLITSCPPPEDTRLIGDFYAPDAEELEQMDAVAEELLADLTGE